MSASVTRLPTVASLSWDDCRLLVESVTDYAIFMLDREGRVATWNAGAQRIKGYSADEIIGAHVSKFYTREDVVAGVPEEQLVRARELGRSEEEGWRVRKDGSRFWANAIVTALRDEQGNLRGYGKVTRDLTARKSVELDLFASEQRFHQLVDAVTDYAIFLLDAAGNIATWNPGARKLKGYEANEIVGRHFSLFYTPEDRAAGKPDRILDEVRRTGRCEDESWRVRKDGSRFWANVIITALHDERGNVAGFAKVTRDLTARKRTEEALRRSEERFRLLVEGVTDYAIYLLDPDGRVTTWNVGAERMKGYRPDEIIGESFTRFFPSDDVKSGKPARELEAARALGRFEDEGWRCRKDGTLFWANVVVTALRDAHGELVGFAKITRDLTHRREAEENERRLIREQVARAAAEENERMLRESERAAKEAAVRAQEEARRAENATRVKDEFLATVSHELRTPLNALLGYASLLRVRFGASEDAALVKAIDAIHRNAQSQARIVDDILDVSRIVTGKLRIETRAIDLVAVCEEAIDVVRPSASAKGIALELFVAQDPAILVGDPERLRQVVWNLLSNAVKFTDRGGIVTVRIAQESSGIVLSVADTGRGIEADFLPHVFERFKQADGSTTRKFGGLGLGLAIVRHIVELHGGRVTAESEGRGKGAMFRVSLPVRAMVGAERDDGLERDPRQQRDRSEERSPSAPSPAAPPLKGVRVVVVDDDEDARDLVRIALAAAGASVETADSAATGLEAIRRVRPQVLVSDIGMPEEDGYALMRKVRELDSKEGGGIPSIALTAYTRNEDRAKAVAAGFTSHVGKPVDPDDLVAVVANLATFVRR